MLLGKEVFVLENISDSDLSSLRLQDIYQYMYEIHIYVTWDVDSFNKQNNWMNADNFT